MKGIAILMMLFLHLFNSVENVALCSCTIYIGDIPLVSYLVRAANPVACFLILSGYGMWIVTAKGDKNRVSRLLKLMSHYWLIMLVFVTIGTFVRPDKYPGSIVDILGNLTAFNTSYNDHWWFLFPYVCLSYSSPWLFKITEKIRTRYVLLITFVIGLGTSFLISRYGSVFLYKHHLAYNLVLYFHLLFPFILGAMTAKFNLFKTVDKYLSMRMGGAILLLCILVSVRCCFNTSVFHSLYMYAVILVFVKMERPRVIESVLKKLGKQSMNMWLIHGFICSYFLHDWLYGFHYPVLIYAILISCSYVCSLLIELIYIQGQRIISKITS